jgi:transcriptional regulator with XRE-family HTH domain
MGTIGHALLQERERRGGISQRVAAVQLSDLQGEDIPQPTYGRWETGEVEPGAQYLEAIFRWLNVDEEAGALLVLRTKLDKGSITIDWARDWLGRSSGSQ